MKKVRTGKAKRKVALRIVGLDGNAFVLLGAFRSQARREGWSEDEIEEVLKDARSGDYPHLVSVIAGRSSCPAG